MADFVSVLRRAVGNLDNNTEAMRQAIYGKARTALRAQLEAIDPPLGPEEVKRQTDSLDTAIANLEAEFSGADAAQPAATPDRAAQPQPAPPTPPQAAPEPPVTAAGVSQAPQSGEAGGAPRPGEPLRGEPGETPAPESPLAVAATAGRAEAAAETAKTPRPTEYYEDDDSVEKGGSGRFLAWIILLLVLVGIAGVGFWQRETVTEVIASLTASEDGTGSADGSKIDDRVPGTGETAAEEPDKTAKREKSKQQDEDAAPAEKPAAESPPDASAADGERVAQALLIEEGAGGAVPGNTVGGSVDWSLADDTEAVGGVEKVVRGVVRVPESDLTIVFSMRQNKDAALPASHLVELVFEPGPDFQHGSVSGIPGLIMKATPRSTGQPLVGAVVPVMDGYFLVGLSESELDMSRNIEELKTRDFIDIPIVYGDGGRAMLSIAKGETGTRVFNEAFTAWGE